MSAFLDKLTSLHDINHCTGLFSVDDVQMAILQQKSGKAVGPDGIPIEAYKFGGHRLTVYFSIPVCVVDIYRKISCVLSLPLL